MQKVHEGTDTLFTALTGGTFATVSYLIGGVDNLATALAIFMVTDYVTGVISAIHTKSINYDRAIKGLTKKAGLISFVIVANQLDIITGNTSGFLRNAMMMCLIGTEGISILDNGKRMGNSAPGFLIDSLKRMVGTREKETDKKDKDEKGA